MHLLILLRVDEEESHGKAREHNAHDGGENGGEECSRHALGVSRSGSGQGGDHREGLVRLSLKVELGGLELGLGGHPASHGTASRDRSESRSARESGESEEGLELHGLG